MSEAGYEATLRWRGSRPPASAPGAAELPSAPVLVPAQRPHKSRSAELFTRGLQEFVRARLAEGFFARQPDTLKERLGPGVVDSYEAAGSPCYVALGDSLAANAGVERPRLGYVSRLHRQLQERDGRHYGLRNFGVRRESSRSLVQEGQLAAAAAFMTANCARYVTLNVGGNDLLEFVIDQQSRRALARFIPIRRFRQIVSAFRANLEYVFATVRDAAPEATIVFLNTYNPFSVGLGLPLETAADRALGVLNATAARLAGKYGVLVADAFTPLAGTAAVTTHILDDPPDVHPRELGHDLLAAALLAALEG